VKIVKSREQRRSTRTGNGHGSLRCHTLKAKTLRVPAGWNKPASRCGRLTCREVEKTWGRVAMQVEPVSVTSDDDGAEREQTWGDTGIQPEGSLRETLKSAEAWKRMVKYWTIPYFGGGVGTLRVLKHLKV